jgi:restriction system protein
VDVSVSASVQVSLRVNSFASANAGVEWVRLDDSLERAQTLMMGKDYSQLAVQSGPRDLRGAISWESIAQAKIRKPDADLRDAMFTPEVVGLYDDLLARIPLIVDASFAFVRASDRQICGIVTTADLSDEFATLAKPFFLLAEVERRLRRIVDNHFTSEEIAAIVDPADPQRLAASASDLTIGEFVRLLEEPRRWAQLHWSLDRVIFIAELNDIRLIRNEIMHFSPDPLDDEQIRKVELFIRMLRRLDHRSLFKIQFKEVQSYSGPIGHDVCAERPPVIGMKNTPRFEMSDRALDRGAQLVYLDVEFLLPIEQLPALRLLKRGNEVPDSPCRRSRCRRPQ